MSAWEFEYTTPIMPRACKVIKYADTPEKAISFFATGTIKAKNLMIIKSKAPMSLTKDPVKL
tara:strand:+ start:182 stop:367 length:186 start_codon:yes stop_codon:yes gene_type:complete